MNYKTGFSIIINDRPIGRKQIHFPKTKKKRIRKKWEKRPQNYKNLFMEQPMMDTNGLFSEPSKSQLTRR